jgi:uncharacterized membrane protein
MILIFGTERPGIFYMEIIQMGQFPFATIAEILGLIVIGVFLVVGIAITPSVWSLTLTMEFFSFLGVREAEEAIIYWFVVTSSNTGHIRASPLGRGECSVLHTRARCEPLLLLPR